jgi:hypothetical protein
VNASDSRGGRATQSITYQVTAPSVSSLFPVALPLAEREQVRDHLKSRAGGRHHVQVEVGPVRSSQALVLSPSPKDQMQRPRQAW